MYLHWGSKKAIREIKFTVTFRVLKKISHAYTSINFRPSVKISSKLMEYLQIKVYMGEKQLHSQKHEI